MATSSTDILDLPDTNDARKWLAVSIKSLDERTATLFEIQNDVNVKLAVMANNIANLTEIIKSSNDDGKNVDKRITALENALVENKTRFNSHEQNVKGIKDFAVSILLMLLGGLISYIATNVGA